jgi:uncharacterized protein (TIGR00266 family)
MSFEPGESMKHEVLFRPSFAMVKLRLEPGESIVVESGAMVAKSTNMKVKTSIGATHSGFFGAFFRFFLALVRKFLGGESMFFNTFTPQGGPGEVWIAPAMVGDLLPLDVLPGKPVLIQSGSYVASTPGVQIRTRWGGLRSLLGREGAFLLQAGGEGQVWVNAYGGIKEVQLDGAFVCDTGHMVAFDSTLDYRLRLAGKGLLTAFKSGEGFVFEFHGTGRLLLQSRNLDSLVSWVSPLLPS